MKDLTIASIEALPCSVPLKQAVTQGLGSVSKRDTVIVKVTTADGLTGYGESYNGRAPLAVAATIDTTLRDLLTGMDAAAVTDVWGRFESRVLANHGTCAACVCAMSGIDMALWDVKGKALGLPLYRLLGGAARPVPAYAGGFALGYAAPAAVTEEALAQVALGYRAVKLRLGDSLSSDSERARAMRAALPSDVALLADANCRYSVDDVRAMLPVLADAGAGWLEEPFPPYADHLGVPPLRWPRRTCRSRRARTATPATSSSGCSILEPSRWSSPTCPAAAASPRRCASPRWPPGPACRSARTAATPG